MATPANWCSDQDGKAPPQPPDPRLVKGLVSTVCQTGWRVLYITGMLRDLLIKHFATPLNVEEGDLRHLVWRDDERTRILIESVFRWRGDLTEKRPAVLIKRNAYQNLRLGIGDAAGRDERGMRQFATFWTGSHTVFCIHGSGASVEILATEVQRELTQWHPLFTSRLGLLRWQVTNVGEISEIEEAREHFAVPITVGWAYQELWRIDEESLKLYRISLSALLDNP